jgi:parvulin-like peptidyl-prolyl isomerase
VVALDLRDEVLGGRSPEELGDPFLRGRDMPLSSESTLAGIFGADFAAQVVALSVGEWSPPIRSSYGYHLVFVRKRQPLHAPSLAEVRDRLLRDWRAEEREKAHERAFVQLRAAYDVQVEGAGGT